MRTLVPAETLVYLETNDLAAALQPIVDSKPFAEVAESKPDFSALKGVQVAVAVTGFETSEEKVNDEQSIGKVRPRFVAVADTHAWDYQAVKFAETRLNSFVQEMLGGGTKMGRSQKSEQTGGTYITWTATDGRLAHALILDAVIYFANDETAIDKALAVRGGEADSLAKMGKPQPSVPGTLASGYVSIDGVANIASIVSVKFASESSELSDNARPALAEMLARLIRGSVAEIGWNSIRSSEGIEDKFVASRPSLEPREPDELTAELVDSLFDDIEATSAEEVASVLAGQRPDITAANTLYRREDRFTATTAERRITTDLGFLGWIIAQLAQA